MKRIFACLCVLFLCVAAKADAPWGTVSSHYKAERLLTATDLVETDQLSRWITSRGDEQVLYCDFYVSAISGAGAQVTLKIIACDPSNIVSNGCVDETDGSVWYVGADVTAAPAKDTVVVTPVTTVNADGNMSDEEVVAPVPPIWAALADAEGTITVSYTLDCAWY